MSSEPVQHAEDPASEFVGLMLDAQRGLRNYLLSLHPVAADIDDLMQQTALTLWKEFHRYDRSREFMPWALRIAYFEVLRMRTMRSRDMLVFSDDIVELLADEEPPPEALVSKRLALAECLGKLNASERELLMACYGEGGTVADLAVRRKAKPHQLYHQLDHIRRSLIACVRRQMRVVEGPFD